jgi:hypothetical protein
VKLPALLLVALALPACAQPAPPPPERSGEGVEAPQPQVAGAPDIVFEKFGEIVVNGEKLDHDIVLENGQVRKREKGPSRPRRPEFNHTPLTPAEAIPWNCETLVVGTGMYGRLPVVPEFEEEAKRRGVKLVLLETPEAVSYYLEHFGPGINAVFHITC